MHVAKPCTRAQDQCALAIGRMSSILATINFSKSPPFGEICSDEFCGHLDGGQVIEDKYARQLPSMLHVHCGFEVLRDRVLVAVDSPVMGVHICCRHHLHPPKATPLTARPRLDEGAACSKAAAAGTDAEATLQKARFEGYETPGQQVPAFRKYW